MGHSPKVDRDEDGKWGYYTPMGERVGGFLHRRDAQSAGRDARAERVLAEAPVVEDADPVIGEAEDMGDPED